MTLESRLEKLEAARAGAGDIFVTYDGEHFSRCNDGAQFTRAGFDGVEGARVIEVTYVSNDASR